MTLTPPTIEELYFDGCPNHEGAVALVKRALAAEGLVVPIQMTRVATDAEARRVGFYGSPTIRVNSQDIVPIAQGMAPGLACRVYRTPEGQVAPVPAYETLVAALRLRG
jgi:hypothetical protein